jgi:hypothetical protein
MHGGGGLRVGRQGAARQGQGVAEHPFSLHYVVSMPLLAVPTDDTLRDFFAQQRGSRRLRAHVEGSRARGAQRPGRLARLHPSRSTSFTHGTTRSTGASHTRYYDHTRTEQNNNNKAAACESMQARVVNNRARGLVHAPAQAPQAARAGERDSAAEEAQPPRGRAPSRAPSGTMRGFASGRASTGARRPSRPGGSWPGCCARRL